jgi:hypothetical protein
MKDMTKIFFKISSFSLVLMLLAGCNDFLDKDVKGYSLGTEYPETRYQAQTLLDATYDIAARMLERQLDGFEYDRALRTLRAVMAERPEWREG